jgi:hypothetical protein
MQGLIYKLIPILRMSKITQIDDLKKLSRTVNRVKLIYYSLQVSQAFP